MSDSQTEPNTKNDRENTIHHDDTLEVTIFDEPRQNLFRAGYPDVLDHPKHYKMWDTPSQAQVQIVCHQIVLDSIQKHAASYANQEIGGILVGDYYRSDGASYLEIVAYVPAPREGRGQNSASHFTFTQTIWAEMLSVKDRDPALNQKNIVGWFHSHPNWGTQPSTLDVAIQQEHFRYEWQTALIYDPIRHEGDFYLWDNGSLVTAPGFYEIFSRVRPAVVTNWRNYLAVAQPQAIPETEQNQQNTLDDAKQQAENAKQQAEEAIGDGYQAQDQDSEEGTATEGAATEDGSTLHRVLPAANTSLRPNQEEISITNKDIFRTFLRRYQAELLLGALIAVLVPVLVYLGYSLVSKLLENSPSTPDISQQAEQWEKETPQVYDPKLMSVRLNINGQEINQKLDILVDEADDTTICASNSQYAGAVSNGANLLLGLKNQGSSIGPSIYIPAKNSWVSSQGLVCFRYDLSVVPLGWWQGAIYANKVSSVASESTQVASESDQVAGEADQMVWPSLEPQDPSFEIEIYEDTREKR